MEQQRQPQKRLDSHIGGLTSRTTFNGTLWMRNNVDIDQIAKVRLLDAICRTR